VTQDVGAWSPLLPVAMVGTDRHTAPMPRWPGAIGDAIAALGEPAAGQAATGVLRAAAILAVCGAAGARPGPSPQAPGVPAGRESTPAVDDPELLRSLGWTMVDGPERLKQAFCLRLGQAGLRLPPVLLTVALEQARQSLAMRPLVQPLLGERGVWLARQRDDWRFAAGVAAAEDDDPRQWDEGTLEQRRAFLAAERARDPRAARERLAAALPELPAKERAELARGLADGLSMDDEPLLEQLRNDRGQDVRAVALDLLLRLPAAAHPRRAAARVAALMARGGLLTGRRWNIEPPSEAGTDWRADQVDPDVPKGAMGQRAWWLYQLVRQVPLGWWTMHTGLSPRELSAWAQAGDWGEPLWRGWRDVLRRAPDQAWAELLLDAKGPAGYGGGSIQGDRELALGQVCAEARERWVVQQLATSDEPLSATLWTVMARCAPGESISRNLAAPIVQRVRRTLALDTTVAPGTHNANVLEQEHVGRALPDLCCTLPLPALADFDDWAASPSQSPALARARHAGRQIIQARRVLASRLP